MADLRDMGAGARVEALLGLLGAADRERGRRLLAGLVADMVRDERDRCASIVDKAGDYFCLMRPDIRWFADQVEGMIDDPECGFLDVPKRLHAAGEPPDAEAR